MISSQMDIVRAAERLNDHIEGKGASRKDHTGTSPALFAFDQAIADGRIPVISQEERTKAALMVGHTLPCGLTTEYLCAGAIPKNE